MAHFEIGENILSMMTLPHMHNFNQGMALDIYEIYKKHNLNLMRLVYWIAGISGSVPQHVNGKALLSSLYRLNKKYKTLRGEARAALRVKRFDVPTAVTVPPKSGCEEETYKEVALNLGKELHILKEEMSKKSGSHEHEVSILKQKLQTESTKLKERKNKVKELQYENLCAQRKLKRRKLIPCKTQSSESPTSFSNYSKHPKKKYVPPSSTVLSRH